VTDRGVIFSGPMIRRLLAGDKTQTRRLATSPLRRVAAGDRLWARENWRAEELPDGLDGVRYQVDDAFAPIENTRDAADAWLAATRRPAGRWRPSIHMPRWASRLTLIVDEVRFQAVGAISESDALAEGIVPDDKKGFWVPGVEHPNKDFPWLSRSTAREMYAAFWDTLHGSGEWLTNPSVVALTFRVQFCNIDRLTA
jgi:hypothetical protein